MLVQIFVYVRMDKLHLNALRQVLAMTIRHRLFFCCFTALYLCLKTTFYTYMYIYIGCKAFCLNGGTCKDDKCICVQGYEGRFCENRASHCFFFKEH